MADGDLLTISDVEGMLGVAGDGDLAIIQTYIAAASAKLAAMCGPIVKTGQSSIDPLTEWIDGGSITVWTAQRPIYSIDSISEWDGMATTSLAWDWNPATGPDVLVDMAQGKLTRRSGNADTTFVCGRAALKVDYWAGRYETIDDVPAKFRQAAMMIVDRLWRLYQASGTSTYGTDEWVPARAVPPMVNELLADELLPVPVA